MEPCINCKTAPKAKCVTYLLAELGHDLLALVNTKFQFEAQQNSYLCEACFNFYYQMWATSQEPELEIDRKALSSPDPLSAQSNIKKEEDVDNIKTELLHEIENSEQGPSSNSHDVKPIKKVKVEFSSPNESDEEILSGDNSVKTDDDSDQSEENDDKFEPPLQDGSKLGTSQSKCDWCKVSIRKQQYRNLPEGLEKDYVAIKTCPRQRSPERVCDGCWVKAQAGATRNRKIALRKRKQEEESTCQEDTSKPTIVETIKLPGYVILRNSQSCCMVYDCKSRERRCVPPYLRKVLLDSYKIYVPPLARACSEHLKSYYRDWSIIDRKRCRDEFTGEEVQAMLDLLIEQALEMPV